MISFIILNWNNPELTIKVVSNIEEYELSRIEGSKIVVVDNGSDPNKREILVDYFLRNKGLVLTEGKIYENRQVTDSRKILILNEKNYGYAKGNNIGLKFAKKMGFKYAILMNNDVELKDAVAQKLLTIMQSQNKIAIIGPKIIGSDGKQQGPFIKPGIYSEFVFPVFYPVLYGFEKFRTKYFHNKLKKEVLNKGYAEVYRLMGCFMLLDLDVLETINWLDENTFLYAEEMILAEKLQRIGYKTAFVPTVTVFHHHEASTKSLGNIRKMIQLQSDLYYYKNYRNYGPIKLFLVKIGRLYSVYILTPVLAFVKRTISKLFHRS